MVFGDLVDILTFLSLLGNFCFQLLVLLIALVFVFNQIQKLFIEQSCQCFLKVAVFTPYLRISKEWLDQ